MSAPNNSDGRAGIVCAGNWILDIVHDLPYWPDKSHLVEIKAEHIGLGGGAANVAADLKALGVSYPITPIGVIGDDQHGDRVLLKCQEIGLETQFLIRLNDQSTAHTHVMNVPGDSRTLFYHPGANDRLAPQHFEMSRIADRSARFFYLGYLALLGELDKDDGTGRTRAAGVLAAARAAGMITCADLVSSDSSTYRDAIHGTLPEIDILFLNEIEAARASGVAIDAPDDAKALERAGRELADRGVRQAVVLHTVDLVVWIENGDALVVNVPGVDPRQIVSPVGAGDAFAAGVLHAMHEAYGQLDSIKLGIAVAQASLRGATANEGIPPLSML